MNWLIILKRDMSLTIWSLIVIIPGDTDNDKNKYNKHVLFQHEKQRYMNMNSFLDKAYRSLFISIKMPKRIVWKCPPKMIIFLSKGH